MLRAIVALFSTPWFWNKSCTAWKWATALARSGDWKDWQLGGLLFLGVHISSGAMGLLRSEPMKHGTLVVPVGPCSWVHWSYRQWSLLCMDFISLPVWVLSKVGTVLLIGRQEYEDAVWRHECKGYASSIQKVAWQMKTCPPLAGEGGDRIPRIEPQRKKLMNEDKDKSKFHTPQLFETISWFAKFAWFWRLCSGVRGTSRGSMKWSALFVSYWKSWRRPTYVRAAFLGGKTL